MVNKSLGVSGGRMGESSDLTSEMAVPANWLRVEG
jgi:hypothetical protein